MIDWLIEVYIYVQDKLDGKFNINFICKHMTPYSTKALASSPFFL